MTPFSIIIATKDRRDTLMRGLSQVDFELISRYKGEIVVIDNGSTDGTYRALTRLRKQVGSSLVLAREPKSGVGRARNTGLSVASRRVVAFTDDDCYITNEYITRLAKLFDESFYDFVAGSVTLFDPTDAKIGVTSEHTYSRIMPYSFIPTGVFLGANMVFKRTVLDAIGGFDNMLGPGTPWRCEDIDLAARASAAGFTGAVVPTLNVKHHHGRKPGPEVDALKRLNDRARGAYYMKSILRGDIQYLSEWRKRRIQLRNLSASLSAVNEAGEEIIGGLTYLRKLISEKLFRLMRFIPSDTNSSLEPT